MRKRYTPADDRWVALVDAILSGERMDDGSMLYEWDGGMAMSEVCVDKQWNILDNSIDVWPAKRLEHVTVEWVRA